jgi:hypothetical protein
VNRVLTKIFGSKREEIAGGRRKLHDGEGKNFLFFTASRPALGPTQPPIQWVPEVKRSEREAHLQLVPISRKCGSLNPFPHTPS